MTGSNVLTELEGSLYKERLNCYFHVSFAIFHNICDGIHVWRYNRGEQRLTIISNENLGH